MEGPAVGECLVEEWLRSLNLTHYTQAFVDNGYDDLEICKQIGLPDLDAIGVLKESHRQEVINAVEVLKNQSSTHVYFVLERDDGSDDCNRVVNGVTNSEFIHNDLYPDNHYQIQLPTSDGISSYNGSIELDKNIIPTSLTDEYAEGRRAFKTFPKLLLSAIVREKLVKHEINLQDKPFTNEDGTINITELENLSQKYASELKTHPQDVLDRLHELLDLEPGEKYECREIECEKDVSAFSLYSVCSQNSRSVLPPLPVCPSPSHTSRHASFSDRESSRHSSPSKSRSHSSESTVFRHLDSLEEISVLESGQETDTSKKATDTLGRIFKAVSVKGKSGKKYCYKPVKGDLNASQITMGEDERKNIMFLVKEGKLSMEDALELVKQYEIDKKHEQQCLESSSSTEACMYIVNSPGSQKPRPTSKFSPFLLFKFGSQRRKKNSLSQGESTNSSLTSSPELSSKQQTKHYEGTGTQLYSPIQGLRKKLTESKPKSTGFFGSPKGSPVRSSSKKQDKIPAEYNIDTPVIKKKTSFSSPFSRRKKSSTLSKDSLESTRASQSSILDDSGVFDSPSSSRRGSISNVLVDGQKSPIPCMSRTISEESTPMPSCTPLSIHQETVAIVHYSPQRGTVSNKCDSSNVNKLETDNISPQSDRLVSFKPFKKHSSSVSSDNTFVTNTCYNSIKPQIHAVSDSTVNAIRISDKCPPSLKLKQSISSDNYEYTRHIDSFTKATTNAEPTPLSSQNINNVKNVELEFICSECGGKHPKRTSHPLGYCIYAVKDSVSPKRRNYPSSTPPDSQSPKRQHISNSPDSTIQTTQRKHSSLGSPEQNTTETSPTGTIDSGSMKEGHYGSSSTMSVGSETSPSCTIERTTLKPVIKKLSKRTIDKQAPAMRVRSNSFSTGDEYLSSDQEDVLHKIPEKPRSQCKRHSMVEKIEIPTSKKEIGLGHHSDQSIEMPSDQERKTASSDGCSKIKSKSSVSLDGGAINRTHLQGKPSRPQSLEALLKRLGLQHLIPIFNKHGYTTIRSISNIEEGHLNQLVIWDAQDRAKLLTAAQMISDYEDHMTSESSQSSICSSPCHLTTNTAASTPGVVTKLTKSSPSSPPRTLHPTNLTIVTGYNNSNENISRQLSNKRDNEVVDENLIRSDKRPLYENIDNFEKAIPMKELVLCHRGCQSDFDLTAMESLQSSSTSGCFSQEDLVNGVDLQQQKHYALASSNMDCMKKSAAIAEDDRYVVQTGAIKQVIISQQFTSKKERPQVPERTVSLPVSPINNSKTLPLSPPGGSGIKMGIIVKTCRDASTQHGGILQMVKKRSNMGTLMKTSPVSSSTNVKTAEVRHLSSPQHSPVIKGNNSGTKHSATLPRLCSHHKKLRQTPDSIVKTVCKKLHREAIDLTNRPYTLPDGSCGVPVLLVQRYAEELQTDLYEIATAFENIRTKALQGQARDMIINSNLGAQCLSPTEEPRLSSVHDFLISVGLPMYTQLIVAHNVHTVEQLVNNIHTEDLVRIGINDPSHIRRLRQYMKKLRHDPGEKHSCNMPSKVETTSARNNTMDKV